jgi:hypothetical protein
MSKQLSNKTQRWIRVAAAGALIMGFAGAAEAQRGGRGGFNNNDENNFNGGNFGGGRRSRFGGGFGGGNNNNNNNFQRLPNTGNFAEDYGIILDQNIFLRDRHPRPVVDNRPVVQIPQEQTLVLTGISQEPDGTYYAFVEDVAQNRTLKLKAGDEVARGKISEITIDQICYEHEDKKTWVAAGSNLSGTQVLSMTNERAANNLSRFDNGNNQGFGGGRGFENGGNQRGGRNNTPSMPVVTPPPLVGDAGMSIEERMRMRRQQESLPGAARVEIPPAPTAEVAPAPATETFVPDDGLTTEERMRRRRLQEGGGG